MQPVTLEDINDAARLLDGVIKKTPSISAGWIEKKYGVGSSSVITGETTPVTDRPVEQEADIPPAPEGVDAEAWKFMTPEDRALWQN